MWYSLIHNQKDREDSRHSHYSGTPVRTAYVHKTEEAVQHSWEPKQEAFPKGNNLQTKFRRSPVPLVLPDTMPPGQPMPNRSSLSYPQENHSAE